MSRRSAVTTHVLDTARGVPAVGVPVRLERVRDGGAEPLGRALTDSGGRVSELGPDRLSPGNYRLVFDTGAYQAGQGGAGAAFFPEVAVTFTVSAELVAEASRDSAAQPAHYHVPLLLSPFGYSTYRGS